MANESKVKGKGKQEAGGNVPPVLTVNPDSVDKASPIYADSLVHLGVGPFISKLTFGSQGPTARSIEATFTLVLPTNALKGLVAAGQQALDGEQLREKMAKEYDKVAKGE